MMRLIIAGSRGFADENLLWDVMYEWLGNDRPEVVISGTARGADSMGESWAENKGVKVERYPAEWDKYGKSAGYRRNELMARKASHLLVFWDGWSRGAKHMIDIGEREGLNVKVVRY